MKTLTKSTQTPALEQARPHSPRKHEAWMAGDRAHQGDIIFVALKSLPTTATLRKDRQLADGDTSGSRHILIGGKVYDVPKNTLRRRLLTDHGIDVAEAYIGPVFAGECAVEHPQHQHQAFPDHAATVVLYQRNLDAEEREERARD